MWPRRRPRVQVIELGPPPDESVRVLPPDEAGDAATAVARVERFMAATSTTIMQLEDRVAQLETVAHDLTEALHTRPTHGDLLEVRLQGVRIDVEVKRLATEVRAEIAEIKEAAETTAAQPSHDTRQQSEAS